GTLSALEPRAHRREPPLVWELYFVVVLAAVLMLTTVADSGRPLGHRLAVGGLLVAMAAWYVAVGRPVVARQQQGTWRGYVFGAGILALFAPAYALVNSASFMLAALTPLAYMT